MGWASTYENIIERLHNDVMAMAKANTESGGHFSVVDRAVAIQRACEDVIRDLRDFMELATDPTFDLAATYRALQKLSSETARERDAEQVMRRVAEESLASTREELTEERRKAAELARDIEDDASRKRRERLEKRVADLTAQLGARDKEIARLKATLKVREGSLQEMKEFKDNPASFYDMYPPTETRR